MVGVSAGCQCVEPHCRSLHTQSLPQRMVQPPFSVLLELLPALHWGTSLDVTWRLPTALPNCILDAQAASKAPVTPSCYLLTLASVLCPSTPLCQGSGHVFPLCHRDCIHYLPFTKRKLGLRQVKLELQCEALTLPHLQPYHRSNRCSQAGPCLSP